MRATIRWTLMGLLLLASLSACASTTEGEAPSASYSAEIGVPPPDILPIEAFVFDPVESRSSSTMNVLLKVVHVQDGLDNVNLMALTLQLKRYDAGLKSWVPYGDAYTVKDGKFTALQDAIKKPGPMPSHYLNVTFTVPAGATPTPLALGWKCEYIRATDTGRSVDRNVLIKL